VSRSYRACHCCGQIHQVPSMHEGQWARCTRCHASITSGSCGSIRSASRTAAAAVAAFVLFWPAILLPILEIERLGQRSEQSILSGVVELLRHGSYFVGLVVLLFSIVFPLAKIILLMELSWFEILHRRHKAITLRWMEHLGKWSMMDVMLLAFLVMLVKLGNLVSFQFGPAVIAFTLCVAMSIVASLSFDPHAIWDSLEDE
jgi:paraquat-inducible protein A